MQTNKVFFLSLQTIVDNKMHSLLPFKSTTPFVLRDGLRVWEKEVVELQIVLE